MPAQFPLFCLGKERNDLVLEYCTILKIHCWGGGDLGSQVVMPKGLTSEFVNTMSSIIQRWPQSDTLKFQVCFSLFYVEE